VATPSADAQQTTPKSGGHPQPADPKARRALRALSDNRLNDAAKLIDSLSDDDGANGAWRLLLKGLLAFHRTRLPAAGACYSRAATRALESAAHAPDQESNELRRLAAWALHKLGTVYRRQDHVQQAYELHQEAGRIRSSCGSPDELWETAAAIGFDLNMLRRYEEAVSSCREAVDLARSASEEPKRKEADTWTKMAQALTEWGHHDDAVDAARQALELWRVHDIAAVTVARSEMNLGYTFLRQAQCLNEEDQEQAAVALGRALERLRAAQEALSAFGPEAAPDVQWCQEQIDFAERLSASLRV
jgi:tetratricopeptide (TPR) repeat protein